MVPSVSVVIPCYNEVGTLEALHGRIREQFTALDIIGEIIFIDDGSTDGSRTLLRTLAATDTHCRVVFFRRNCGKAAALQTGFALAQGDYVLTMDADLQDDPAEIPHFLEALRKYDVVSGWKAKRHDPIGKTFPSKIFNGIVRHVTGLPLHDMNCGWKGYRTAVVREINLYGELHRFIPALAAGRGFTVGEIIVTHHPRRSGVSKYGWERFLRGLLDLVTVVYLSKNRFRPLHLLGGAGVGIFVFGLMLAALLSPWYTIDWLTPPRWIALWWLPVFAALIVGPLFVGLGLVAEILLAATFAQQPLPPVSERLNCEKADLAALS